MQVNIFASTRLRLLSAQRTTEHVHSTETLDLGGRSQRTKNPGNLHRHHSIPFPAWERMVFSSTTSQFEFPASSSSLVNILPNKEGGADAGCS